VRRIVQTRNRTRILIISDFLNTWVTNQFCGKSLGNYLGIHLSSLGSDQKICGMKRMNFDHP
jgi:hypothetical protein